MPNDLSQRSCLLLAKPRYPIPGPWGLGYPLGLVCALTEHKDFAELPLQEITDELPRFVPLVITAAPHSLQDVVRLVQALPRTVPRMLVVFPQILLDLPSCEDARAFVNVRPVPSNLALARWLSWRLTDFAAPEGGVRETATAGTHPVNLALLALAMAGASNPDDHTCSSTRSLRRWARVALHCCPSDLRRLAELAKLPRLASSVDQLAARAGTTPTRLRQRVSSALGLGLKEYNGMVGWAGA